MPPVTHARCVTMTESPMTSIQLASTGRPARLVMCRTVMRPPTAAMVVARRTSVSGSTSTAIPSSTVTTAKNGHDTIQRARARCRRSARASSGGREPLEDRLRSHPASSDVYGWRSARQKPFVGLIYSGSRVARPASCRCALEYRRRNLVGKSTWALCSEQGCSVSLRAAIDPSCRLDMQCGRSP